MTDVDKLNDQELRTKLLEFGFPPMPVTGTTRKVMVKKLKLLLENKKKNDGRRSLGQYSSEEDSDSEISSKKAGKNRRATIGEHVMQPPTSNASQRKSAKFIEAATEPEPVTSVRKEVKVTETRMFKNTQDEFDTGSESEPEPLKKGFMSTSFSDYISSPKRPAISTYQSHLASNRGDSSLDLNHSLNLPQSSSRGSFYSVANAAEERLNQIRSRLSLSHSADYDKPSYSSISSETKIEPETPFLSNFTRRLSQLSPSIKNSDYDDTIKENDSNGASGYSINFLSRPLRSRNTYSVRSKEDSVLKKSFIPFIVLGLAFLFFIFIGIMYLGIKSDTSAVEPSVSYKEEKRIWQFLWRPCKLIHLHTFESTSVNLNGFAIPYCKNSDSTSKRGVNCVSENESEDAINLHDILIPYLMGLAEEKVCSNPDLRSHLSESEIVMYVKTNYAVKDENQIKNDLTNLEILSFANPGWGISVVQLNSLADPLDGESISQNMEQVVYNKDSKITALVIRNPKIPWLCSIYNKICLLFKSLFFLSLCFGLLYLCNMIYKYYKSYKAKEHNEIMTMVERIMEILQCHASESEDHCIVINHIRDLLLPILDRKKKQNIWNRAVEFINENESRVRIEVQEIKGEPFKVWRWLGPAKLSSSPKNKSWQGQAFETQIGAVNSLPCSPTPCLKIRGMVEDGDRNTLIIKESVLSKLAHKCRILHCVVDDNSHCVYLKCADTSEAAIAYRNLHGWWYAGHLVTVKYLRLERYMQRFPDSPVMGPPFLKATGLVGEWSS